MFSGSDNMATTNTVTVQVHPTRSISMKKLDLSSIKSPEVLNIDSPGRRKTTSVRIKNPKWYSDIMTAANQSSSDISISPRVHVIEAKKSPRRRNILMRTLTQQVGIMDKVQVARMVQAKDLYTDNRDRLLRLKTVEVALSSIKLDTPYTLKIDEMCILCENGLKHCIEILHNPHDVKSEYVLDDLCDKAISLNTKMGWTEYCLYKDIHIYYRDGIFAGIDRSLLAECMSTYPEFAAAYNYVVNGFKLTEIVDKQLFFRQNPVLQLSSRGRQVINSINIDGTMFWVKIDMCRIGNECMSYTEKEKYLIHILETFPKMTKLELIGANVTPELVSVLQKNKGLTYLLFIRCNISKDILDMLASWQCWIGLGFVDCTGAKNRNGKIASPRCKLETYKMIIKGNTMMSMKNITFRKLIYDGCLIQLSKLHTLINLETIKLHIHDGNVDHVMRLMEMRFPRIEKFKIHSQVDITTPILQVLMSNLTECQYLNSLELVGVSKNMDYLERGTIFDRVSYFACGTMTNSDVCEIDDQLLMTMFPRLEYLWFRGGCIVEHQVLNLMSKIKYVQVPTRTVIRPSVKTHINMSQLILQDN